MTNRAVVSPLAFFLVLLAGCAHEKSEPAGRSLPSAPPGVADGCRNAADVAAFDVLCPTGWPQATRPTRARPRRGRVLGHDVVELPTRLIRTTRVHGQTAGVMKAPPYPKGGIHGDHTVVMWNEGGHGYLVSTHSESSRRAATQAALQIARSTRPGSD